MNNLPKIEITKEHVSQYENDGFFILDKVIPDEILATLRSECNYLIEQQNKEMDEHGVDELNLSRRNSRYFVFLSYKERKQLGQFIFSDLMESICKSTIGENAYLFWEQFVVKGTDQKGAEFTWHQDSGYVDGKHKPYVNCWIPLDDVNEENGTVYLLPYSKAGTKEKVEHKIIDGSSDRVGYFGDDPGIAAVAKAGSIVVFSSTTFHRSGANKTDKFRRAWAIQYSPEIIYEPDGSLKGLDEKFLENGSRV
ncbi:MAG: phytanoyl-CoA dioxygenase family protein [Melioribacteraceae bacterium]|nr:phytanoyl-CoA dioxygenase family protein [Melioribacteraceae bacterium]MCF8353537.1 phytanoyl-CoA dioxygenase family protein [Melioribacteraceae bacterium]MCF8392529.1 phytanoyl-CoA dioxygenase family protein [Melioribacteraceae bacterium]MCF8418456.1 phytanoyl-CoA dioxygenase family protein [Melioribacteraceae bacterium]